MEELWIFGQTLSIVLLGAGAVICLANAGLSDVLPATSAPVAEVQLQCVTNEIKGLNK